MQIDQNTKTAAVILVAAILISAVGSLAIAFAVGYLAATVINSPSFDKSLVMSKLNEWLESLGWKKVGTLASSGEEGKVVQNKINKKKESSN